MPTPIVTQCTMASVVEMVDTQLLKSWAMISRNGSSPFGGKIDW